MGLHTILDLPTSAEWFADCRAHGRSCRLVRDKLARNIAYTARYTEHALWGWEDVIANAGFCAPCCQRLVGRARLQVATIW